MLQQLLASSDQHVLAASFILSGIKGIFVLIGGIIAALVCGLIAKTRATVRSCSPSSAFSSASSP